MENKTTFTAKPTKVSPQAVYYSFGRAFKRVKYDAQPRQHRNHLLFGPVRPLCRGLRRRNIALRRDPAAHLLALHQRLQPTDLHHGRRTYHDNGDGQLLPELQVQGIEPAGKQTGKKPHANVMVYE